MHAVAQLKVAERELGVVDVGVERIELRLVDVAILFHFPIESFQRFEELPLVGVIERLAKVQIL